MPGESNDAVSAYTQVKMSDASQIAQAHFESRRPKQWWGLDDPMVPLERKLYGHSVCRRLEKVAGRTTNLSPFVVKFTDDIDHDDPTPLIDQVYLGCTLRASVTQESNIKIKSDPFGKITTTNTQAKSKIKDISL